MRARKPPKSNGRRNGKAQDTERPVGHDGKSPVPLPLEVHTEEQLTTFLNAVSQGIGLDIAAREIDSTSTRMKRLLRRDPEWQEKLDDALRQGAEFYSDRLKATARVIALRTDPGEVVPRILEVELATHVEGYEHLRRDRVRHEGAVMHGLAISVDPALLDALPLDELQRARDALAVLSEVVNVTEQPALPPAA